jgi:hypothetical protein
MREGEGTVATGSDTGQRWVLAVEGRENACELSGWADPLSNVETQGPFNMTMVITGGTCESGLNGSDIIASIWSLGAGVRMFLSL